jgi:hypothetical protein
MNLRNALLAGLLALACGPGAVMWATAETAAPAPAWVVDPAVPGDNLPPAGRSLFDQLFAVDRNGQASIDLPFPFAALLARLDAQLARDPGSALPPAKRVLIPLGRSLQRTAAAPDYFAFPRVVVAVDAQPAANSAPYLKDRLYIGYQEKSAVLEVISYNEAAGRFEFQLVKDYRAGGRPQVVYANRTLCFACHQNGAPIFSRALWDETNANPQAAELLAASGHSFYGIPAERGVDIPYAIDNATERANGFALTQRLWRDGCGADDPPARRCRAGLFAAALRHALSGGQAWVPDADFAQTVAAPLRAEAGRRWPGGLAVGDPDLPNRNPLQGLNAWPADDAARIARSHVPARFDPLLPRPPREIRQLGAPESIAALAAGLAEFIPAPERRQIEAALAKQPEIATTRLSVPCRIAAGPPASRWSLHCAPPPGQPGRPGRQRRPRQRPPARRPVGAPDPARRHRPERCRPRNRRQGHGKRSDLRAPPRRTPAAQRRRPCPHPPERAPRCRRPGTGTATLEIREDFAAVDRAWQRWPPARPAPACSVPASSRARRCSPPCSASLAPPPQPPAAAPPRPCRRRVWKPTPSRRAARRAARSSPPCRASIPIAPPATRRRKPFRPIS